MNSMLKVMKSLTRYNEHSKDIYTEINVLIILRDFFIMVGEIRNSLISVFSYSNKYPSPLKTLEFFWINNLQKRIELVFFD